MATADLHKPIQGTANSPRNAFDVGYSSLFTSPAGLLLPCYVEDVKAGDKLKLSLSSITRTRPVNTAAFMSFDEFVDFWYVPYHLIWSDYDSWRLSTPIRRNSYSNSNVGEVELLPHTTWASIGKFCEELNNFGVTPFALDSASCSFMLRQLDLLGYSIPPIGDLLLYVVDDSFGTFEPETSSSSDSRGLVPGTPGARPGRHPGSPNYNPDSGNVRPPSVTDPTPVVNLLKAEYDKYDEFLGTPLNYFRLAAYQCIYMSSYRNEEYEKLDPSYYNVDNLFWNSTLFTSSAVYSPTTDVDDIRSSVAKLGYNTVDEGILNTIDLWKLFTPRYKNWRKDVFTGVKPTDLMSVNGMTINNGSLGDSFNSSGQLTADGQVPTAERDFDESRTTVYDYAAKANSYFPILNSSSDGITAANLRLLFAQDKFARANLYADKDFRSQMKALFGVDVQEPDVPRYLGTHRSNVSINEITATSAGEATFSDGSASSVLGELAGKGYQSSNGFVFDEEFKYDGIVMGIHYIMPRNNYNSYRLNKFNTKLSRFDYYYPAFDGLGYSPVFSRELSIMQLVNVATGTPPRPTNILGYSSRYYEYKERQNEVHGCFMSGQSENNWTLTNNKEFIDSGSNPALWKIFPNITDPIFSMAYDGSQATDPFMCYFDFQVTRVSDMQIQGVPQV